MSVAERYGMARRWRTCPKCNGRGSDVIDTILRHNFHERPCSICGGDGRVRYSRSVAIGVALRGRIDHEIDPAAALREGEKA